MISILIATYGGDEWAEMAMNRAFLSVAHLDTEIIVGHDADGTIASARNGLAAKATGDWLCFLDADDELAPGYLEAMERELEPMALLTPIVQKFLRGRGRRSAFYNEVPLSSGNWLVIGTVLERSLFERVGGFGDYPHGFEDWSLWFKCDKVGAHVKKVRGAVYRQHINPQSKHRLGWRDKNYQVSTHLKVQAELEAWTP